jgi:hypothetical protein
MREYVMWSAFKIVVEERNVTKNFSKEKIGGEDSRFESIYGWFLR